MAEPRLTVLEFIDRAREKKIADRDIFEFLEKNGEIGPAREALKKLNVPDTEIDNKIRASLGLQFDLEPAPTTQQGRAEKGVSGLEPVEWNSFKNAMNGYIQGLGVPFQAGGIAARQAFTNWQNGMPFTDAVNLAMESQYPQEYARVKAARADYKEANPIESTLTEVAGATALQAPVIGAMGIPGMATNSFVANTLGRMGQGAIEGGLSAALGANLNDAPVSEQLATGAGVGAAMRGVVNPLVGSVWNRTFGSSLTPQYAQSAKALQNQGVDVRPGQVPGMSPASHGMEWAFGGNDKRQLGQFSRAALRQVGMDVERTTLPQLEQHTTRVGQKLDTLAQGQNIPSWDIGLWNKLIDLKNRALNQFDLKESLQKNVVKEIDKVMDALRAGGLSGEDFRGMVRRGSVLSGGAASSNPIVSNLSNDLRKTLNEAFLTHAPKNVAEAYQLANRQYAGALRLQKALDKSSGFIDPSKLQAKLEAGGRSITDFGELGAMAPGAQRFLPSVADSEKGRGLVKRLGPIALGGGGAAGLYFYHPENIMQAAPLIAGVGAGVGGMAAANRPWIANALVNETLGIAPRNMRELLARGIVALPDATARASVPATNLFLQGR